MMFAKDLSNKIISPPRHQGTKFRFKLLFCLSVLAPLWMFFPVYQGWGTLLVKSNNIKYPETRSLNPELVNTGNGLHRNG